METKLDPPQESPNLDEIETLPSNLSFSERKRDKSEVVFAIGDKPNEQFLCKDTPLEMNRKRPSDDISAEAIAGEREEDQPTAIVENQHLSRRQCLKESLLQVTRPVKEARQLKKRRRNKSSRATSTASDATMEMPSSYVDSLFDYSFDDLPAEYGGPRDAITDKTLQQEAKLHRDYARLVNEGKVPQLNTVLKYTSYTKSRVKYSAKTLVCTTIYANRLSRMDGFSLTMDNWRAVWLACLMIAMDLYEENPLKEELYHLVFPAPLELLMRWKAYALEMLRNSLPIVDSAYAKCIFKLRSIFWKMLGKEPIMRHTKKIQAYPNEVRLIEGTMTKDDMFIVSSVSGPDPYSKEFRSKIHQALMKVKVVGRK
jgi:hypothetical protein